MDEYWIYKKIGDGSWSYLTSTQNTYFEDTDETVLIGTYANETYAYYKLKAVDVSNNQSNYSNTVSIKVKGEDPESNDMVFQSGELILREPELFENYPNPFNPSTTISFGLPENFHTTISIYSITGEKVRTVLDQFMEKGFHKITWNGKNQNGQCVSAGIYIYELKTGNQRLIKKMLLTK